jgi:hypothetical protein
MSISSILTSREGFSTYEPGYVVINRYDEDRVPVESITESTPEISLSNVNKKK